MNTIFSSMPFLSQVDQNSGQVHRERPRKNGLCVNHRHLQYHGGGSDKDVFQGHEGHVMEYQG